MTNKCTLPAICYEPLQTEEELARAEEETLDLEREWLARHEQEQKQRKTRSKPETPNRLLRTKQAAQYIGVSDWKLRQMVLCRRNRSDRREVLEIRHTVTRSLD